MAILTLTNIRNISFWRIGQLFFPSENCSDWLSAPVFLLESVGISRRVSKQKTWRQPRPFHHRSPRPWNLQLTFAGALDVWWRLWLHKQLQHGPCDLDQSAWFLLLRQLANRMKDALEGFDSVFILDKLQTTSRSHIECFPIFDCRPVRSHVQWLPIVFRSIMLCFRFRFLSIFLCKLQLFVWFIAIGLDLCLFFFLTSSTLFSILGPISLICHSMLFSLSECLPRNVAIFTSSECNLECILRCKTWWYWRKRSYGFIETGNGWIRQVKESRFTSAL